MTRSAVMLGKIVVSVAVIAWVLSRVNLSELLVAMGNAHMGLLVLAFSLHGVGLLLSAMRWAILLRIEKIDVSFKFTILMYWIGSFFNAFLPSNIGGDVIRGYLTAKQNGKVMETVITVIFERVAGTAALLAVFGIGLIWFYAFSPGEFLSWELVSLGALYFGGHIIPGVSTASRAFNTLEAGWRARSRRIGKSILKYGSHKPELCRIFLLSFLLQINVIVYYSLVAIALDIHLSFVYFCLFIPPILILTMLPISLGGLGVREAAFLFFFAPLGTPSAEILSLSLWSYVLALLASLSGGLVYSFYRPFSR